MIQLESAVMQCHKSFSITLGSVPDMPSFEGRDGQSFRPDHIDVIYSHMGGLWLVLYADVSGPLIRSNGRLTASETRRRARLSGGFTDEWPEWAREHVEQAMPVPLS